MVEGFHDSCLYNGHWGHQSIVMLQGLQLDVSDRFPLCASFRLLEGLSLMMHSKICPKTADFIIVRSAAVSAYLQKSSNESIESIDPRQEAALAGRRCLGLKDQRDVASILNTPIRHLGSPVIRSISLLC